MRKHLTILFAALVITGFASITAQAAESPILTALEGKGVVVQKLDATALNQVRGTWGNWSLVSANIRDISNIITNAIIDVGDIISAQHTADNTPRHRR